MGASVNVSIASTFTDPDGDALTYTASSSNTNQATVSLTRTTLSIRGVAAGTPTITVRATDPGGLYVEDTFTATISVVPIGFSNYISTIPNTNSISALLRSVQTRGPDGTLRTEILPDKSAVVIDVLHRKVDNDQLQELRDFVKDNRDKGILFQALDGKTYETLFSSFNVQIRNQNKGKVDVSVQLFGNAQ